MEMFLTAYALIAAAFAVRAARKFSQRKKEFQPEMLTLPVTVVAVMASGLIWPSTLYRIVTAKIPF